MWLIHKEKSRNGYLLSQPEMQGNVCSALLPRAGGLGIASSYMQGARKRWQKRGMSVTCPLSRELVVCGGTKRNTYISIYLSLQRWQCSLQECSHLWSCHSEGIPALVLMSVFLVSLDMPICRETKVIRVPPWKSSLWSTSRSMLEPGGWRCPSPQGLGGCAALRSHHLPVAVVFF